MDHGGPLQRGWCFVESFAVNLKEKLQIMINSSKTNHWSPENIVKWPAEIDFFCCCCSTSNNLTMVSNLLSCMKKWEQQRVLYKSHICFENYSGIVWAVCDGCKPVLQASLGEPPDEMGRVCWGWSRSTQSKRDARLCWGYSRSHVGDLFGPRNIWRLGVYKRWLKVTQGLFSEATASFLLSSF